mgnify:CR=1 FL=1
MSRVNLSGLKYSPDSPTAKFGSLELPNRTVADGVNEEDALLILKALDQMPELYDLALNVKGQS